MFEWLASNPRAERHGGESGLLPPFPKWNFPLLGTPNTAHQKYPAQYRSSSAQSATEVNRQTSNTSRIRRPPWRAPPIARDSVDPPPRPSIILLALHRRDLTPWAAAACFAQPRRPATHRLHACHRSAVRP
jgi:hypothetical protein